MRKLIVAVLLVNCLFAYGSVTHAADIVTSPTGGTVIVPADSGGVQSFGSTPTEHNIQSFGSTNTQTNPGGTVQLLNPLGANGTLPGLLMSILAFVVRIGTFVVIFMLVYVGYLFVAARGAPAKIAEAKSALLWTVVGALILLGAQAIAAGIQATVQSIGSGSTVSASPNAPSVPTGSNNGRVVY